MFKNVKKNNNEDHWLSVSDLMAGLMMVFLFISIALMRNAMIERDMIKDVAVAYQDNQVSIYDSLIKEFGNDLEKWNAKIDNETLTFTFKSPDTLFDDGEVLIKLEYQTILNDFFPRYLETVYKFKDSINEIRIEGHTSSKWNSKTSIDEAYFKNMQLSQGRTRSVLQYIYELEKVKDKQDWIKDKIAAVGFSSSKLILKDNVEDEDASKRVSFRVITNSDIQIRKILDMK